MKVKISQDLFRKREIKTHELKLWQNDKVEVREIALSPPLVQTHQWKGGSGDCPQLFKVSRKINRKKTLHPPANLEGDLEGVFEWVPYGPGIQIKPRGLSRLDAYLSTFTPPIGSMELLSIAVMKDHRSNSRVYFDISTQNWKELNFTEHK